jgi:hypothetical protein
MDFQSAIRKARSLSDYELHQLVNSKVPWTEEHIAAKLELDRRDRNRRFWRQDLVAWLALVLSVVSLIVSGLNKLAT